MTDTTEKPLTGSRIGFFGRGGAGKTTTTVLVAKALRRKGYEICILDADSTNIGLAAALGVERQPRPLLDYYGGMVFSGGRVTCPVDDPTRLPNRHLHLDHIDSGYCGVSPEGIKLLVAGKITAQGVGPGCDGPIGKIARDLQVWEHGVKVTTLLDFKAGFEDSARGLATTLDWAIVVVDPSTAGIQMAADMAEMVLSLKARRLPATAHLQDPEMVELADQMYLDSRLAGIVCILNRVHDGKMAAHMRERLTAHGIDAVAVIPDDPRIAAAWTTGECLLESDRSTDEVEAAVVVLMAEEEARQGLMKRAAA